jgi:hypothetical protein
MMCETCGHDTLETWHTRRCPLPTFNVNAEFAGLVLLIDAATPHRNQYGRCGQTYSDPMVVK